MVRRKIGAFRRSTLSKQKLNPVYLKRVQRPSFTKVVNILSIPENFKNLDAHTLLECAVAWNGGT